LSSALDGGELILLTIPNFMPAIGVELRNIWTQMLC